MLRRIATGPDDRHEPDCVRSLRAIEVPGYRVSEATYVAAGVVPAQRHERAVLCLAVEGGYRMNWGRTHLRCGTASLVLQPPGQVFGAQISSAGSRCLTVAIDPAVLPDDGGGPPDFERLNAGRRLPPHWLAFQLHRELGLADDLSAASVASTIVALLAELTGRPGLKAPNSPLPWLRLVLEQIEDEFCRHHTLESLGRTAGVHPVHLAREFHHRFGCTVGHYIRQRRVEFACHRLTASRDPLSEIAVDAGFADQSHFTNTFRRLIGMPPGRFRAHFAAPAVMAVC